MNNVRMFAQLSMNRIIPCANACRLHRIYKISFASGDKYVGQTSKFPEQRLKEHMRDSSKCTMLKEALKTNKEHTLETLAIVGPHQIDVFERVAIAMEDSVGPEGLNMTVGGKGVKKPDAKYEKFSRDVRSLRDHLKNGHFVSYDMMLMKGELEMSEEEFDAVKRLS